jgi:hypothetical protein
MKTVVWRIIGMLPVIALVLAGCATPPPEGTTVMQINKEDFVSDSKGILRINNFTNFDVAIFAGKVGRGNYMEAIHAKGNRLFDITKVQSLSKKGAFLFRVVSYETLNRSGKANIEEKNVIYTGLVAYDLDRPDRIVERDIFARIDDKEQTFIYLANPTKYVVELRLDSPDGDKVAVLGPGERNKQPPPKGGGFCSG